MTKSICGLPVFAIPDANWPEKVGLDGYGTASEATGCHTHFTFNSHSLLSVASGRYARGTVLVAG